MFELMKKIARDWPLYDELRNWEVKRRWPGEMARWKQQGCPVPPPHLVKQGILREYAKRHGLRVFVETGTCYGDMVEAMRNEFDRLYSIEVSPYLYGKVTKRFRRCKHITLLLGDSGQEIKKVMAQLDQPALFWLDGHYSGGMSSRAESDTPIRAELECILGSKRLDHVIVIDDARCYGVDKDYPPIEELTRIVHAIRPDMTVEVKDDCIRYAPKR